MSDPYLSQAQAFCFNHGAAFKLKWERCTQEWVAMFKRVTVDNGGVVLENLRYIPGTMMRDRDAGKATMLSLYRAYEIFGIPLEDR